MNMYGIAPFMTRFESLKDNESSKDKLIEDLLAVLRTEKKTLSDIQLSLERERDVAIMYQRRYQKVEEELRRKLYDMECNTFVTALIDGDCMNFLDSFIQQAGQGGQEAESLLRMAIIDHIRAQLPSLHDVEIVIRVYANMRGLAKTYIENGTLANEAQLDAFIRGFNMSHALSDFTDAGNGKECSDFKLKGLFKLHVSDVHCKHIVFGGSSDNGYARLLVPYSGNADVSSRITLLEGPPFAIPEMRNLTKKFATVSFQNVFRNSKIISQPHRVSFTQNHAPELPNSTTLVRTTNSQAPKPMTWATVSKAPASPAPPLTTNELHTSPKVDTYDYENDPYEHFVVLYNSKGERIDSILPPVKKELINSQKGRKLCNPFQLCGFCPREQNGAPCHYSHDKLTSEELNAQRYIARLQMCNNGLDCQNEYCLSGHACPYRLCILGSECKFPKHMHNVSRD